MQFFVVLNDDDRDDDNDLIAATGLSIVVAFLLNSPMQVFVSK